MSLRTLYSPARIMSSSVAISWRDGAKVLGWVDGSGNPALHLFCGWDDGPDLGLDLHYHEHYISINNGATWTQLPDPPYSGRHNNLVFLNPVDNKIYVCFGDGTDSSFPQDVWSFSWAGGGTWTEVTSNAGIGQRQGYGGCIDDKYAYVVQGYIGYEDSLTNDVWRAPLTNLATWTKVADTPTAMHQINNAALVWHRGKLYYIGGATRQVSPPHPLSTKIFCSKDRGLTWTEVADSPLLNSSLWANAYSNGTEIIYNSGSDTNNSLYANRRVLSIEVNKDTVTIKPLIRNIPKRHACAVGVLQQNAYIGEGFGTNDMWQLKKLSSSYNTVAAP
jgi:hypothetical protein